MTNKQHPITPPPELVEKWWEEARQNAKYDERIGPIVATKAAQWGADQELEACCEWVSKYLPYLGDFPMPEDKLRISRRPKPPSLKEQALEQLRALQQCGANHRDTDKIRKALEQLND